MTGGATGREAGDAAIGGAGAGAAGAGDSGARGVIFDLDGTLADTPAAIATITAKVLADRGAQASHEAILATVGRPLPASLARLMDLPVSDPRVAEAAGEYGRQFGAHVRAAGPGLLYPGVPAGLDKLTAAGFRLAMATSKVSKAAHAIAGLTGLDAWLTVVAGDDSVPRGKPHPDLALHVAEGLGLAPGRCVVVGDGVPDAEMARAAGMAVLGVSYGVSAPDELIGAGAGRVVDSFPEAVAALLDGYR
ncbi:HAD family hydrolase [Streptomyces sp. NBC_01511]|uniref:HAD family hydrolase n=1 Tax=unclassified Streptomyces TaxID=2593676 RepID=UPI0038690838